jgi:hypothetical protein
MASSKIPKHDYQLLTHQERIKGSANDEEKKVIQQAREKVFATFTLNHTPIRLETVASALSESRRNNG